MWHLLFPISWICIPLLWLGLLRFARVALGKATIPAVLIWFIVVFQYVGLPVLYFQLDPYRCAELDDTSVIVEAFLLTATTTTLLIAGYCASRVILGTDFSSKHLSRHHRQRLAGSRLDLHAGVVLVAMGMAGLAMYVAQVGISNVAVLEVLYNPSDTVGSNLLRSGMGNAFEGRYYLYKMLMRDGLQIGSSTLFVAALLRPNLPRIAIFLLSAIVCVLSFTIATEKGPIVNYFLGLALVGLFVKHRGYITRTWLVGALLTGCLLVALLYVCFMGASDPVEALLQGGSRVFTGQIEPLYHYLVIFPKQMDFLLGRSMPNPAGILPFEYYPLTIEVMNLVYPWHVREGIVGSMPTYFCGELWANFSYIGVLAVSPCVGFAVCWISDLLDRFEPTPLTLASIAWFSLHIKDLSNTPVSNYIVDAYAVAVIVLLIGFHHFRRQAVVSTQHSSELISR